MGGTDQGCVPPPAPSAFQHHQALPLLDEIGQHEALVIPHDRPGRDAHDQILAALAGPLVSLTVSAGAGRVVRVASVGEQSPHRGIGPYDHIAAPASGATDRLALRPSLLSLETDDARAAVTGA